MSAPHDVINLVGSSSEDASDDNIVVASPGIPTNRGENRTPGIHGLPNPPAARPRPNTPGQAAGQPREDFTRWPSVPRHYDSDFPDVLINTSLAEPELPPVSQMRHPTPPAVRHLHNMVQAHAHGEELDADRDRHDYRKLKKRVALANETAGELYDVYASFDRIQKRYEDALTRFQREHKDHYDLFAQHCANAKIVTSMNVRFFDVVRWYQAIPGYLTNALEKLSRYHHQEIKLQTKLEARELKAGSWRDPLDSNISYVANMDKKGDFGFEKDFGDLVNSIASYNPPRGVEGFDEAKYLKASFEVRKVRYEHEPTEGALRFVGRDIEKSLDAATCRFVDSVQAYYSGPTATNVSPKILGLLATTYAYKDSIEDRYSRYKAKDTEIDKVVKRTYDMEKELKESPRDDADEVLEMEQEIERNNEWIEGQFEELTLIDHEMTVHNPYSDAESD